MKIEDIEKRAEKLRKKSEAIKEAKRRLDYKKRVATRKERTRKLILLGARFVAYLRSKNPEVYNDMLSWPDDKLSALIILPKTPKQEAAEARLEG